MSYKKFILLGCALLTLGFLIGRFPLFSSPSLSLSQVPTAPSSSPTQPSNLFLVSRVVDGDTIELENGEKVRYIGIDTPETLDPRKPIQCFGKEAAARNKELVEGKRVRLEKDVTDRDKYNRLLRYIYVSAGGSGDEIFVNLELVKQGFAHSYTYPPDVKYQDLFVAAEKEARDANRGLWLSCPIVTSSIPSNPSPPSVSNCLIKGNIGATGEKIYHLPGCGSYEKTKIDESRGEKWFCSEDEAQNADWRKAKNC